MGARVLLALRAGADDAAAVLRGAGFTVEQAAWERIERAVAASRPGLCVVEVTAALAGPPAWTQGPEAPAWIAVAGNPAHLLSALAAGAVAVLDSQQVGTLLAALAERALVRRAALRESAHERARRERDDEWILAGPSAAAQRLGEALTRVASTPRTTVLVRGPIGSPVASLARLVHVRSVRAAGPLVEIHAARVEASRWAEVLGDLEGPGSTEGGTLVVHEAAHLDQQSQAALAEFFESRGGAQGAGEGELGLRLVATSTVDLAGEVEAGRLREDLFYRLNVLTLGLPPLVERREDLALLAGHCAARAALALGRPARKLTGEQRAALGRRVWPGDLCELSLYMLSLQLPGELGRAAVSELGPTSVPGDATAALGTPESLVVGDRSLKSVEEALIRRVLEETGGNKLRAAEILGIHRTTLYHKLEAYGLDR